VAALEQRLDELGERVDALAGEPEEPEDAKAAGKRKPKADPKAKKKTGPGEKPEKPEKPGPATSPATHAAHDLGPPPAQAHGPVPWSYRGERGPDAWGGLDPSFGKCASGEAQSPIDILPQRARPPDVVFVYQATAGAVVDNGHTLQVDLERGSYAVVDGERFELVQFHVHTPSEHTIAGDVFPLEVHLVHQSQAGALAVVGVLFAEGEPSTALAPVWKSAPRSTGQRRLKSKFDPSTILPREQGAYRYDGSLTTPPCSEGVRWIVMRRTRTEDPTRIAGLRDRFGSNARPIQELGARELR